MKTIPQLITKFSVMAMFICAGYSSLDHPAWAAKMYKWVDANGNISYQDKPPPKNGRLIETSELKQSSPSSSPSTQNQNIIPLTVYTIANCKDCARLIAFLKQAKIPVVELSLQDREVQSRILRLSGKIAAPSLFIGNTLVTDLSVPGLITALKGAGYTLPASVDSKPVEALSTSPAPSDPKGSDSKVEGKPGFGESVVELTS
ncbi:MAG: glutaredoxin [Arenicella sp.]|jgi:glutaredoxin